MQGNRKRPNLAEEEVKFQDRADIILLTLKVAVE